MAMNEDEFQELLEGIGRDNEPLTEVDLKYTNSQPKISFAQFDRLCDALKKPNQVKVLNLRDNEIGPEGGRMIASVLQSEHCKLTHLDLANNRIGAEGAVNISAALQSEHCRLTHLDFGSNFIGDQGAKSISTALESEHCKLIDMNLERNNIGDQGAQNISTAFKSEHCRLTHIDLRMNRILDKAITKIANVLQNNYSIVQIEIDDLQTEAVQRMRELLIRNKIWAPALIVNELTQSFPDKPSSFLQDESQSIAQRRIIANKHHPEVPLKILAGFIQNNLVQKEGGTDNSDEIKSFFNNLIGQAKHGARLIMMASLAYERPENKELLETIHQQDPKVGEILKSAVSRIGLKEYFELTGVSKFSSYAPAKLDLSDMVDVGDMSKHILGFLSETPNSVTKVRDRDNQNQETKVGSRGGK